MTMPGIQEIRITRKGLKFGNAKNGPSAHIRVLALLTVGLSPDEISALREALTRHGVDVAR
jgi:flagellar basal body P-ring protein FlgI